MQDNDKTPDILEWEEIRKDVSLNPSDGAKLIAEKLDAGGPPPSPDILSTSLIIDTDIGGDPDDAIAIVIAAKNIPELKLVITSSDKSGVRAQFVRLLLDYLGRTDVRVACGAESAVESDLVVEKLVPDFIPLQNRDFVTEVTSVLHQSKSQVRWLGIGSLTNLSIVLSELDDAKEKLVVTQMGGAFNYRHPDRAEHNFRLDPTAVQSIFKLKTHISLVISDVTFNQKIEITQDSVTFKHLLNSDEEWAKLLVQHFECWFDSNYPGSIQHDSLALSAAMLKTFVDLDYEKISVDGKGIMRKNVKGNSVFVSFNAHYELFMKWLHHQLFS